MPRSSGSVGADTAALATIPPPVPAKVDSASAGVVAARRSTPAASVPPARSAAPERQAPGRLRMRS